MTDEFPIDDESIAKWAEGLSPEGAPGIMTRRMREYLGDETYEKAVAQSDALAALHLARQTTINTILGIVSLYGLVGLVGLVALIVKFIF